MTASGFSEGTLADAQTIAKLGYVVFAEDIFGKGVVPKDVPEMTKLIGIYDNDRPADACARQAGFDVLKAQPMVDPAKLAAVGYCFGGTTGIELDRNRRAASRLHLGARRVQQFHAGSRQEHQGPRPHPAWRRRSSRPDGAGQLLISQLRAAKVDFELNLYSGATHGFTHPQSPSEVRADDEYKVAMARFFKDLLAQ